MYLTAQKQQDTTTALAFKMSSMLQGKHVIFFPTVRKIKLDVGKARGEILMS